MPSTDDAKSDNHPLQSDAELVTDGPFSLRSVVLELGANVTCGAGADCDT